MNVILWIAAGLLALVYLPAGLTKAVRPRASLEERMPWVTNASAGFVKFVGVAEVAGALGVILPQATGIAPVLVPIAAGGLALVALGAIVIHLRAKEYAQLPVNVVLLALAVFVAIGRAAA